MADLLYRGFIFLLMVLAVYRLALLVAQDVITSGIRRRIGKWAAGSHPHSFPWYVAELVNCAYCTGVWFALAGAVWLGAHWQVSSPDMFLLWLSLAGAQAFLFSLGVR